MRSRIKTDQSELQRLFGIVLAAYDEVIGVVDDFGTPPFPVAQPFPSQNKTPHIARFDGELAVAQLMRETDLPFVGVALLRSI